MCYSREQRKRKGSLISRSLNPLLKTRWGGDPKLTKGEKVWGGRRQGEKPRSPGRFEAKNGFTKLKKSNAVGNGWTGGKMS